LSFDLALLKFFNITLANPAFDFFFKIIGDFHIWRWPLMALIAWLLWKGGGKGRWLILTCLVTVAIVDPAIHWIFKPLFARLRPCQDSAVIWLRTIDGCGGKYGFPSSHAANLVSQAIVVGSFYKKSRFYLYSLAVLVCISRIYLGVHYPSDVIAGAFFGLAIGLTAIFAAKNIARQRKSDYFGQGGD
jgi:undecaprenyl-diphosphatase